MDRLASAREGSLAGAGQELSATQHGPARLVRRQSDEEHQVLRGRVADLEFGADEIANGSRGLLDEVATGKITGEEEHWSRTDLWDFQANIDGAKVGYEGLRPLLQAKESDLDG